VRRALAAALLCAAAVAGCGGGDGDDGPDTPKPAETLKQFEARITTVAAAIQRGQCDAVEVFNSKAGLPLPCEEKQAKQLFAGFRITGSRAYGTGAVVEFKDAEVANRVGVYTAAIGDDGKYQLTGPISPIFPVSTLDQEPKDEGKMDEAAESMIDAIRANDCEKFAAAAYLPTDVPKDTACRQELELYKELRAQLEQHKDAKPERLDGNAAFMFYALRTGDEYRTLIVSQGGTDAAPKGFVTFRGPAEKKT
jgi:hypothetical protein